MCGIAGIIGANSDNMLALNHMVKTLHHRGPDDLGIYKDQDVAIGMTRLAILDLSPLGHQPMQSQCKRYWIIYNGECYNFLEIRKKLEALGDRFASHSDTEVVLQAYIHWGAACLQYMNGMFAFAIWDKQEKKLFAARDHLGVKPFYYAIRNEVLIFGSEIKTLLASGKVENRIDNESVFQYFTFGHIQQPKTILQDVYALMPGHYLTWNETKLIIKPYWTLTPKPASLDYQEAKECLLEQVNHSVKMQLVSDRPLGLFLSGGLDSASVLAAMYKSGASIKTFSIGFEENPFTKNEAKEAMELARHFGASHNQIIIDANIVRSELESFWQALDQPSVDGLNTYLVSKYARKHMTVALSGLGGDELFAGYSRHARILWKLSNVNRSTTLINRVLPDFLLKQKSKLGQSIYRLKQHVDRSDVVRNYTYSRTLTPLSDSLNFLSSELLPQLDVISLFFGQYASLGKVIGSRLDAVLSLEMQGFMGSVLLRDMDAASMWHSLEVRFPLIDYKLVEFAFSLPDIYKSDFDSARKPPGEGKLSYRAAGNKKILMDTMEPLLPTGFMERPKNGFKLPINLWLQSFKKKELKSMVMDEKDRWESYLNAQMVDRLFDKEYVNHSMIWKMLCFVKTTSRL